MTTDYPIRDVSSWKPYGEEAIGTKRKQWLEDPEGRLWLFKHRHRADTGDDWSEKIAAGLAALLELPHAHVDLAVIRNEPGIIALDFTGERERGQLVHGNQLLFMLDPAYPRESYRVAKHTVAKVFEVLRVWSVAAPSGSHATLLGRPAGDIFAGYLLLDALIANQDRHHQNWGILVSRSGATSRAELAPTFDHASSLGQILRDDERIRRLNTTDAGYTVEAYCCRARSALFGSEGDDKPLGTFEVLDHAAVSYDDAIRYWTKRLANVPDDRLVDLVEAVPAARMSQSAKQFALAMLRRNRDALLTRTYP